MTMLQKIKDEAQPDAVAIAFDLTPHFRHKMYDGYKPQCKGRLPELSQQMPTLKELLADLGYPIIECEGFEADDILGDLAKACEDTGNKCLIVTGDREGKGVGAALHDVLAVCAVVHPQVLTEIDYTSCHVDLGRGYAYGETALGRNYKFSPMPKNCYYAKKADSRMFFDWLYGVLKE